MADEKTRRYSARNQLPASKSGPVDVRATQRNNGAARSVAPVRRAAPATTGAHGAGSRVRAVVAEGASVGQRALRASAFANALTAVPAALSSLLGSQSGRVGARNFVDGLSGAPLGGAPVAPIAKSPADATGLALTAARAEPATPIAPEDKTLAYLDQALRGGMTLREAQAVAGMIPDRSTKTPDAKDTVLDATASISKGVYDAQVKDIMARRAAGEMTLEEAQAQTAKATDAFFLRNTALVGNPLSYAQANMLSPSSDKE